MKCSKCDFYKSGFMWNECTITDGYCFKEIDDCTLINDDGTISESNEYFRGTQIGF